MRNWILVLVFTGVLSTHAADPAMRKVLFLTQSAGFMHDVVNRTKVCTFNQKGEEQWNMAPQAKRMDTLQKKIGSLNRKIETARKQLKSLTAAEVAEKQTLETTIQEAMAEIPKLQAESKDLEASLPLSFAELTLMEIAKKSGAFEVTCTQNPADVNTENLKNYDAIFFYTTGELAIPRRQDLLDYVKSGKGFVGSHCAVDTFHNWKEGDKLPYIDMIGGEFLTHHKQESARVEVVDPKFPAATHFKGKDFTIVDEWYRFKNVTSDIEPVLRLDTKSMAQAEYNKLEPYVNTWHKNYGKGRVFYTALGHRGDVWRDERFQTMILSGILWAMGIGK